MFHQVATICTSLHQLVLSCTNLHQPAPSCNKLHHMHQVALRCTNLQQAARNLRLCAIFWSYRSSYRSKQKCLALHYEKLENDPNLLSCPINKFCSAWVQACINGMLFPCCIWFPWYLPVYYFHVSVIASCSSYLGKYFLVCKHCLPWVEIFVPVLYSEELRSRKLRAR